jgi:hypothetical protein
MEDGTMAGMFYGMGMREVVESIEGQQAGAERVAAASQKSELQDLRDQVARLALLNQAMWELVRDRLQLSDADLEKIAQEVDLRDGVQDGRMSEHPLQCPKCGRVSNSRHKKCLYCGLLFEGDVFG